MPGVLSHWLFFYHRHMVATPLRWATPMRRLDADDDLTISDMFMQQYVRWWGDDILSFPLLSPRFCQFLIAAGDAVGTWEPAEGDAYGAPEMRLGFITPRLATILKTILVCHVNPLFRRVFLGAYAAKVIEDPFLIRYDMATQRDMGLHMDGQSDVSLAVALNDAYEGGGLHFPRQSCIVRQLPVGHALMFLGGPTHLHEALPITGGVRYSLTVWTRGDPGEVADAP